MQFEGPPEAFLGRCAEKIEREATPREQADLLAVAQVLTELRFPDPDLLAVFGGEKPMMESPLLKKMVAERIHRVILALLKNRFGAVPRNVIKPLEGVLDEEKLANLNVLAGTCPDLQSFREALLS